MLGCDPVYMYLTENHIHMSDFKVDRLIVLSEVDVDINIKAMYN